MAAWGTVTFDHNGGTGASHSFLYINYASASTTYYSINYWATTQSSSTKITSITPASRPLKTLKGYYAYGDDSPIWSVKADGYLRRFSFPKTWGNSFTVTAEWEGPTTATIQLRYSTGTEALAYDSVTGKWYFDAEFTNEFSASNPITIPTRECYRFLGCWARQNQGGDQYINADGTPTAAFLALAPTSDINIYADWERVTYKVTLAHASGSPASTVFYVTPGSPRRCYSDYLATTQIWSITPPTKEYYRWEGSWSTTWTSSAAVQYIDSDGEFLQGFVDLPITGNVTLSYSNYWTQVSYNLNLLGATGWTFVVSKYYIDKTNGGVYQDYLLTTPLTSLPIPTRLGWRFTGFFSAQSGAGTLYVAADGTIQSALQARTLATNIYAWGRAATYTMTLDPNGGTTTQSALYYDATSGDTAFFDGTSAPVTAVTLPTYTGNVFTGYYTSATGGTQVVDASGNILSSWIPTENATVYAHWSIDVSIIDVEQGEGSGGTSRFYHRSSTGKFYSDSELTTEITTIDVPSLALHNLNGIYTSGGVLAVNASGVIQSTFNPSEEFVTLTATYTRFAYKVQLTGGTAGILAIYRAPNGSTWYSDLEMTTAVTNVGVPTKTGYRFGRYVYGSTTVIDTDGTILSAAIVDEDYIATAVWGVKTYTLNFDGNGATPSVASKTVTYNQAIGTLPTLRNIPTGKTLEEWRIDGMGITAATVWSYDEAKTAVATWESGFASVKDFFYLGSDTLIPESSDSGDTHQHTCVYNATDEAAATETSGIWRNPRVTYRVVGDMTLAVTLGAARAATKSGTTMTISGYMIASVEVHTAIGEAPTVTVTAVANEGADAIKTYAVSIPLSARHRPQNLLSAISGGGELQSLTLVAKGDPVVLAENGMPCASDITHGRIEVSATTGAYNNESAPTAGTNFTKTAEPASRSGTGYKTFSVNVRKELT